MPTQPAGDDDLGRRVGPGCRSRRWTRWHGGSPTSAARPVSRWCPPRRATPDAETAADAAAGQVVYEPCELLDARGLGAGALRRVPRRAGRAVRGRPAGVGGQPVSGLPQRHAPHRGPGRAGRASPRRSTPTCWCSASPVCARRRDLAVRFTEALRSAVLKAAGAHAPRTAARARRGRSPARGVPGPARCRRRRIPTGTCSGWPWRFPTCPPTNAPRCCAPCSDYAGTTGNDLVELERPGHRHGGADCTSPG